MRSAWILRSLRADDYEQIAVDRGLIAVGWDAVGDLTENTDPASTRAAVRAAYPFVERASAESYSDQLYQFAAVMKPADMVVLLRRNSPDIAVGIIDGGYAYRTDVLPAVRHVRPVRWVQPVVPRAAVNRELLEISPLDMVFRIQRQDMVDHIATLGSAVDALPLPDQTAVKATASRDSAPFADLQRNLNYARNLATAGQHLTMLEVGAFEVPDVFRAAWVQAVAALDHWVRQEVRTRMLRLAEQQVPSKPKGYAAFAVSLGDIERILRSEATLVDVVDDQLTRSRGHLAYQNPVKIREAFSLVSDVDDLWNKVARVLSERVDYRELSAGADVQRRLNDIVRRRNKIAHEYDEDRSHPGRKTPMDAASVTQAIDWIEAMAAALLMALDPA